MANSLGTAFSAIKNYLGFGKTENLYIPTNSFIEQYNLKKESLFKVKLKAYTPHKVQLSMAGVNTTPTRNSISPIFEAEVLYNEDTVSVSHNHNYGDIGGIPGMLKELYDRGMWGIDGTELARGLQSVDDYFVSGKSGSGSFRPNRTEWNDFKINELARSYKASTTPISHTVSFVLMSSQNSMLEVVLPAILFSYLSYPSIDKTKDLKLFDEFSATMKNMNKEKKSAIINNVAEKVPSVAAASQLADSNAEQTSLDGVTEKIKDFLIAAEQQLEGGIQGIFADKRRLSFGTPPPIWTVHASNGLFSMNNAHISDINITFHGPWLRSNTVNVGAFFAQALKTGSFSTLTPQDIFPGGGNPLSLSGLKDTVMGNLFSGMEKTNKLTGFPSWAEVKIVFTSNYNQLFSEDFVMGLGGADFSAVTTGIKSIDTTSSINSNPIA